MVKNTRTNKVKVLHGNKLLPVVGDIPKQPTKRDELKKCGRKPKASPIERMGLVLLGCKPVTAV